MAQAAHDMRGVAGNELPAAMAPVLSLVEARPPDITEWLLTELLASLVEPSTAQSPAGDAAFRKTPR